MERVFPNEDVDEITREIRRELGKGGGGPSNVLDGGDDEDSSVSGAPAGSASGRKVRSATTIHNDWARLIHIAQDPALLGYFTDAYAPLTRAELDAPAETSSNPWEKIVEAFNDLETYIYENPTAQYDEDARELRASAGMEAAFANCGYWNPSDGSRPPRDVIWFRTKLNDLRSRFTRARCNYHKSGNQDAEFEVDEFAKFCGNDDVTLYAFAVWGDATREFFDRTLPSELQREEGVPSDDTTSSSSQPPRKRKSPPADTLTPAERRKRELTEAALLDAQLQNQAIMNKWFSVSADAQQLSAATAANRSRFDMLAAAVGNPALPQRVRDAASQELEAMLFPPPVALI